LILALLGEVLSEQGKEFVDLRVDIGRLSELVLLTARVGSVVKVAARGKWRSFSIRPVPTRMLDMPLAARELANAITGSRCGG